MDGLFHGAKAFLLLPIIVVCHFKAGLAPGVHEGLVQWNVTFAARYMQRPVLAAPVRIARTSIGERSTGVPTFHALEIGQNAGVIPALSTHVGPVVIVARVPANIDHAVDAATTADDFTPWGHQLAATQMGFGLALVSPIIARHIHGKA